MKYIIVGSGFSGSICARKLAEANHEVLLYEKRDHIAGNMYDYKDEDGIFIHKYGPHIFHTNNEIVWKYLQQWSEWNSFTLRSKTCINNQLVSMPFNFESIDIFFNNDSQIIKERLLLNYPNKNPTILDIMVNECPYIRKYADFLYQFNFLPYNMKQWNLPPNEIDHNIFKRVPILLSYFNNTFIDKYQGIPKNGYTNLFNNLLNHKNIKIFTKTDFFDNYYLVENEYYKKNSKEKIIVIYTGPIEKLLNNKFGELPYRSLEFISKREEGDYCQSPIIYCPQAIGYTRMVNYSRFTNRIDFLKPFNTIVYEYPISSEKNREPYYPIENFINLELYNKYRKELKKIKNIHLIGRLADYKYINMDECIENTFKFLYKNFGL